MKIGDPDSSIGIRTHELDSEEITFQFSHTIAGNK